MASLYRAMHQLRKGGLHKALNLADGADISDEDLDKASKSENGHVASMADLKKRIKAAEKAKKDKE